MQAMYSVDIFSLTGAVEREMTNQEVWTNLKAVIPYLKVESDEF
jgi:hypothetical protein